MFSKQKTVSVILAAAALFSLIYCWFLGQPLALADAPADRLNCVSYSPFHKAGQTPFNKDVWISKQQIEADIKALSPHFGCVRTYTVGIGLQELPALAQQYGMQALLGIWIGRDDAENQKEIALGIELTKQYPQVVRALIIGNEVLLRREQTPPNLRNYINQVKAAVPGVPVSYADSWDFWLRYQDELLDSVSFATVHILPFWDDDTVSVAAAAQYVVDTYRQIKAELHDKEVLIGETGWPSYGRQRQDAGSSQINQARFIREFADLAKAQNIPYNIIEAFDQPWKRNSEGAVGGYWGIFDADGSIKFPFRGAVAEAPQWRGIAYAAMGLFFGLFLIYLQRSRQLNTAAVLVVLAISICGGAAWVSYLRDMLMTNRSWLEWLYSCLYALLLLAAIFLSGHALTVWLSGKQSPLPFAAAGDLWNWRIGKALSAAHIWGALRLLFLLGAAIACLLLVFDLRNRDYPLALFSLPALLLALLTWGKGKSDVHLEEMVLAGWIGFAGLLLPVIEHLIFRPDMSCRFADGINHSALYWSGLCLVLSSLVLVPVFLEFRSGQHQKT